MHVTDLKNKEGEKEFIVTSNQHCKGGFFILPINHLRHILKTLMLFKGSVCGIKWHSGGKITCNHPAPSFLNRAGKAKEQRRHESAKALSGAVQQISAVK